MINPNSLMVIYLTNLKVNLKYLLKESRTFTKYFKKISLQIMRINNIVNLNKLCNKNIILFIILIYITLFCLNINYSIVY